MELGVQFFLAVEIETSVSQSQSAMSRIFRLGSLKWGVASVDGIAGGTGGGVDGGIILVQLLKEWVPILFKNLESPPPSCFLTRSNAIYAFRF